ncbi:hypothetical protein BaRGS_00010826 [Batillaria attramentaria]|uniref:Cyclin N-terminal domain-containing protein n=1 Tax=Batillaria attramentaria TaxID=370345 RepID=A0ABD0LEZ3_9CAEN
MTVQNGEGSDHQGIFGTPEEPLFSSTRCRDFPEILQEWLISLATRNVDDIQHANDAQVKFFAIELFDRFMHKHIADLYEHVYTSSSPPAQKQSDWRGILERVQKQLVLRVVSCCQIASKLNSHYKVITVARAKRFLLEVGHNYSSNSILQSELRVLKTLDFRVTVLSPLDYVETLLQVLAHNTVSLDLPVAVYQSVSVKLLTVLYLRCEHLYTSLLRMSTHAGFSSQLRCRVSEVQADKLLMGASVIAASVYIADQQHTDTVITHLHRITQVAREDIEEFVTSLVHEVHTAPDPQ